MVGASQRTGLFDRLGAIRLPSEMLLRVAIRLESAQRIVFPNGRDQDVAFEHGGISMRAPHVHLLRWLALAHDTLPSVLEPLSGIVEHSSPSGEGASILVAIDEWRGMQAWSHECEFRRFDMFPYARFSNAAAGCGQGSSFANRTSCCRLNRD